MRSPRRATHYRGGPKRARAHGGADGGLVGGARRVRKHALAFGHVRTFQVRDLLRNSDARSAVPFSSYRLLLFIFKMGPSLTTILTTETWKRFTRRGTARFGDFYDNRVGVPGQRGSRGQSKVDEIGLLRSAGLHFLRRAVYTDVFPVLPGVFFCFSLTIVFPLPPSRVL